MTSLTNKQINSVANLYDLGKIVSIKKLNDGLINKAYRVNTNTGDSYIFQKLHCALSQKLIDDVATISNHLKNKGWDCPILIKAKNGKRYVKHSSAIWRVYKYIDAKSFDKQFIKPNIYYEIGKLLGKLHQDLSSLKYSPSHKIKGFHDKEFHIQKAISIKKDIQDQELKNILNKAIDSIEGYSKHLSDEFQLIHGDPRKENILFKENGTPYTFIDFDTFMLGSIYLDIGDCLRSLLLLEDGVIFTNRAKQFTNGYQESNSGKINYEKAIMSLKYITIELTLRFVIDAVEENYFSWDKKRYKSAFQHNKARATKFWHLFNQINIEL